jgi:Tol biopolymer transport system component
MFRIRIIEASVAIVVAITCLLVQFGFISRTPLSAAENRIQTIVAGQKGVVGTEKAPSEDLKTVDMSDIVVKEHHWVEKGYAVQLAWTPDGKHVVFRLLRDKELYVMDTLCQNLRELGRGYYLEMSADGKILYVARPTEGLFAINIEDGSVRQIATVKFRYMDWLPNRKHLVATLESGESALMNADGTGFKVLEASSWTSWSSDGSTLLYRTDDGNIYLANADGSGATAITQGKKCGWVGATNKVWVLDPTTNDVMVRNADGTWVRIGIKDSTPQRFSPSGAWVIYKDPVDGSDTMLRIADGKKVKLTSKYAQRIRRAIWFPGEDRIIIPDQQWRWHLLSLNTPADPGAEKLLGTEENPWRQPELSPDSRFIAFNVGKPAQLGIANADGTKVNQLTEIPTPPGYILGNIAWSPFGNAIAYRSGMGEGRVGVIILGRKGP